MANRSAIDAIACVSTTSTSRRSTRVQSRRHRPWRSLGARTSSSTVITTSSVRLGCASNDGMLTSAEKTSNTEPCFGDLRRVGGRGRVVRHLDDVTVPGDGVHQGDRIRVEQAQQLVSERPETAGLYLDDAAVCDHVRHEAVDDALGLASGDGVALLQGPVQRPFVELADGGHVARRILWVPSLIHSQPKRAAPRLSSNHLSQEFHRFRIKRIPVQTQSNRDLRNRLENVTPDSFRITILRPNNREAAPSSINDVLARTGNRIPSITAEVTTISREDEDAC